MDNSISDMFSTSDIFDNSNITINNNYENLRIIFEEVLCSVSFVDVEENVFKDEIPKLKQACIETVEQILLHLKNIQNSSNLLEEIKQLIKRYTGLLNFALSAVNYISNNVPYSQIQSLPLAVSEILLQAFKHCKESDTTYGNHFASVSYLLTDLFKKTNELQSAFFNLLNNILIYDYCDENNVIFLVKVAEILATIGEIVSNLDIKTTAELWKAYLILLQKNKECIKDRINIEAPLNYFCSEIENSLGNVEGCEMKHVEKSLKIISFNLKIVIKLCTLFECTGSSIKSLFDLLLTLNRFAIPYLQFEKKNPKFIDLMQMYVTVASEPLLKCIISNREFSQYYFKNIKKIFENNEKRLAALFLTMSLLKKCTRDLETKKLWISYDEDYNIIFTTFLSTDQFHTELSLDYPMHIQFSNGDPRRNSSLYEYLQIHLISLIITVNNREFKNIQHLLFKSVMQINLWKSILASDIWIALGRYGSAEFCYESLKFLINIHNKLQNNMRVETNNLNCLIQRNYCILPNKYKNELTNLYPFHKYIKLWTIIGVNNIESLSSQLENIIDNTTEKIDQFLEVKSVEFFQNMCELLELLSTYSYSIPNEDVTELTNKITNLWHFNIDSQICDRLWLLRFVKNRSRITCRLIQYFNNEDLLQVLKSMKDPPTENSKLYHCSILKNLATKQIQFSEEQPQIFNLIAKIFNNLLKDKNPVIKQQALESFSFFALKTNHQEILPNIVEDDMQEEISNYLQKICSTTNQSRTEYFRTQSKFTFQHKCPESFKFSEPVVKKPKLDTSGKVVELIQNLKVNCDNLVEHCKNEAITDDILTELNIVCSKLQVLLNK